MCPMLGYFAIATVAVTAIPSAARAQDSTLAERREAAMVLDHTFNAPIGEPIRVFLAKGIKYRAEVQGSGLQLQLRPLLSSVQAPQLQSVLGGRTASASGETLYTILPRADAEYLFITIGGQMGSSVKLRVYAMPTKDDKKP